MTRRAVKRAGERIEQLTLEVEQLLEKAEQADRKGEGQGLRIPDEIARREKRKAVLSDMSQSRNLKILPARWWPERAGNMEKPWINCSPRKKNRLQESIRH